MNWGVRPVSPFLPSNTGRGRNMQEEIWKQIKSFPRYFVSSYGRVESRVRNTPIILQPNKMKIGYTAVNLSNKGEPQHLSYIHRLVAEAFIPNPQNKRYINHIDGDKTNNRVENLEWVTNSENIVHSREVLKNNKGVCEEEPVKCVETGEIFASTKEAGEKMGLNHRGIAVVANGGTSRRTCGGYHWEYLSHPPKPYTPKPKFAPPHYAYSIRCVETGEIYNGSHEASRKTGICQPDIAKAARDNWRTAGGFHWERLGKIAIIKS